MCDYSNKSNDEPMNYFMQYFDNYTDLIYMSPQYRKRLLDKLQEPVGVDYSDGEDETKEMVYRKVYIPEDEF